MRTRIAVSLALATLAACRAEPPVRTVPGERPFDLEDLAAARAEALEALAEYTRPRAQPGR